MTNTPLYRQGDILLAPIDIVPDGTYPIDAEDGRLILARGEITGHHHSITDTADVELVTADEAAELYLLVHGSEPVALTHQEHATIELPPGNYRVVRQREYTPERLRQVAD